MIYNTSIASYSEDNGPKDKIKNHEDSTIVLESSHIDVTINQKPRKLFYEEYFLICLFFLFCYLIKIYCLLLLFSFLYIDGLVLFKYSEIDTVKNTYSKNKIQKIRTGLDKIVAGKENFENKGLILFRKNNKIPGNYQTDMVFQVVTIYFPETSPPESYDKFIKEFKLKYLNEVTKQKNLLRIQSYKLGQLLEVQFFDNDMKFDSNNPQAKSYYAGFTSNGIVMSKFKVSSPVNIEHSFRYAQMLSCHQEDPQKAKKLMKPSLAGTYQTDDACIGMTVNWNSVPVSDLICALANKPFHFRIQRQILASTLFKNCFDEAMEEIVLEVKNTGNDLTKTQISPITRQKYVNVLEEILENDYDKYVNPNKRFYKNFLFLKKGAKQYIIELIGQTDASDANQASKSTSASASSEQSKSKFDIENYSSQAKSASESSAMEMASQMQSKWKEYREKYGGATQSKSVISTANVSGGSVIKKTESSVSEGISESSEQLKQSLSNSSISIQEQKTLNNFISQNNDFFNYMNKNNIKLDKTMIENIKKMSIDDFKSMIKKQVTDPNFKFIYEKKFNKATNKDKRFSLIGEGSFDSSLDNVKYIDEFMNSFKAGLKKEDLKIYGMNTYGNSRYTDDAKNFSKKTVKCKEKARSMDLGSVQEEFDEPPIDIDTTPIGKNITIAIPPKDVNPKSIKLPTPKDDSVEIPPYDSATVG